MEEKRFKIKVTIVEKHERFFSVPAESAIEARRKVMDAIYKDGDGYIYDSTYDESPSDQKITVAVASTIEGKSWMEKGEIYAL